jgi:HEAT repeat protein
MVRRIVSACALALALAPVSPASAAASDAPDRDLMDVPTKRSTSPKGHAPKATTAKKPADGPQLDWRSRVAVAIAELQKQDAKLLKHLEALQPDTMTEDAFAFTQPELHDPRAAAVLLRRLLQGADSAVVRCALVDALPATGGDWQEAAAALVAVDASPRVRKQLVEVMRYAEAPHNIHGLRLGMKDEDLEVQVAAARTAGFSRNGADLSQELYSSTFDADWDLRAAAVQALGMLKLPKSRDVLLKALDDEEREVRLQALLALEQLDPEAVIWLPQLDKLAKDRKSHRIARKAELLLQKRRAAEKANKKAGKQATATSATIATP